MVMKDVVYMEGKPCKYCGHDADAHDEDTGQCTVILEAGQERCNCIAYVDPDLDEEE
jgi:hypothetical protein